MPQLIGSMIAIPTVLAILSLILNALLAALLSLTYSSLTNEQPIAILKFDPVENTEQEYIAYLYDGTGSKIDEYKIYGDQWRMDAKFIKMEYWSYIFGVDSKYALNRLEGRYKQIEHENSNKHIRLKVKVLLIHSAFLSTLPMAAPYIMILN